MFVRCFIVVLSVSFAKLVQAYESYSRYPLPKSLSSGEGLCRFAPKYVFVRCFTVVLSVSFAKLVQAYESYSRYPLPKSLSSGEGLCRFAPKYVFVRCIIAKVLIFRRLGWMPAYFGEQAWSVSR